MSEHDDFFEEDEPIEDIRAAWRRGEKGLTDGPRELDDRAKSVIDSAVRRADSEQSAESSWVIDSPSDTGTVTVTDARLESGYVVVGRPSVTIT